MKKLIITAFFVITLTAALLANAQTPLTEGTHGHDVICDACHAEVGTTGGATPSPFWSKQLGSYTPPNVEETVMNMFCLGCHDEPTGGSNAPSSAIKVRTHSSFATGNKFGEWSVECLVCHHHHYQRQFVYYRNLAPIKLATGKVTNIVYNGIVNGLPQSTIKFNNLTAKAGWTDPASWRKKSSDDRGLIIYPNGASTTYSFSILSANADTIVIRGDVTEGITRGHLALVPQKTFTIVYGMMLKEKIIAPGKTDPVTFKSPTVGTVGPSTGATVRLLDKTGTNSFATKDGTGATDTVRDGICQVCHTQTAYWKFDGTGATHYGGANCMGCHPHSEGFKAMGCDQCHGNPPTSTGTLVFKDKSGGEVVSDATGPGAHAKHTAKYGQCSTCHTGGMTSASQGDDKINIGFALNGNLGGSYDGKSGRAAFPYAAGGTTTITTSNTLSCSTLYCHSSGQGDTANGSTPTYATPTWTDPASGACGTCHKVTAAGGLTSGSHARHLDSAVAMGCGDCHTGAAASSYTSANHVNKSINVANSYTAGGAPGNGYGTCSVASCHGGGSPTWGNPTAKVGCYRCHGDAVNGNPAPAPDTAGHMATNDLQVGAHQVHLKGSSNYSAPIGCNECHTVPENVEDAGHIKDGTPGVAEVPLAGTLARTNERGVAGVPAYSAGQCSNVYCHDSSRFKKGWAGGSGRTPTWSNDAYLGADKAVNCGRCHGNPPGGAHPASAQNQCNGCHSNVNEAGDGFVDKTLHGNGILEATAGCTGCHGQSGTDGAPRIAGDMISTLALGAHVMHVDTKGYSCDTCHNGHGMPTLDNKIKINFTGMASGGAYDPPDAWQTNPTTKWTYDQTNGPASQQCSSVYCHSSGQAADGGAGAPVYATPTWGGSAACGSCHATTTMATGSHTKHLAADTNCGLCHTGATATTYSSASHINQMINVSNGAVYTAAGAPGNGYGTCSTACHSATTTAGVTPVWGATGDCATCHAAAPATGSHGKHLAAAANCGSCHDGAVQGTNAGTAHFDNNIDVTNSYPANVAKHDGSSYSGTCSTASCHSDGKGNYRVTPAWGSAGTGCNMCHDALPTTGSHTLHIAGGANYGFDCAECHGHAGSGSTHGDGSITVVSSVGFNGSSQCSTSDCHSDGKASLTYKTSPAWGGSFTGDRCSGCHSNSPDSAAHGAHVVGIHYNDVYNNTSGKIATAAAVGTNAGHGNPAYSTTISCNICHYDTVTVSYNDKGSACSTASCHGTGGTAKGSLTTANLDKSKHVNRVRDIRFADVTIASKAQLRDDITSVAELDNSWDRNNGYKAGASSHDSSVASLNSASYVGGSCSSVACHNGNQVAWTAGAISCDKCHTALPK